MRSRAALLMAVTDGPPIEFRAVAATAAAAATVAKPSGLELGDVVVVTLADVATGVTLTTTGGSAWARSEINFNSGTAYHVAFWKVLTALDLTNAWTLSVDAGQGGDALAYISHGANAVTLKEAKSNGFGATTLSFAGITKAAGHYGLISAMVDKAATGIVEPTGFTLRYRANHGTFRVAGAGLTLGYVDGTAVTWTGCDALTPTPNNEVGWLLEVTGP